MLGSGSSILHYQIMDSAASGIVLKDTDGDSSGESLISGEGSTTVSFDVIIPQGQTLYSGTYTDQVTISMYRVRRDSFRVQDTAVMVITASVSESLAVSVAEAGGTFESGRSNVTLDFGSLSEGNSAVLDLIVRSSVNYSVGLESAGGGRMVSAISGETSSVPYTLEADGSLLVLESGVVEIAAGTGPTPAAGDRVSLFFEIGDPSGATSGIYEDALTIVVTTR